MIEYINDGKSKLQKMCFNTLIYNGNTNKFYLHSQQNDQNENS